MNSLGCMAPVRPLSGGIGRVHASRPHSPSISASLPSKIPSTPLHASKPAPGSANLPLSRLPSQFHSLRTSPSRDADVSCQVTLLPGSSPETQKFYVDEEFAVDMPIAASQKLPEGAQTALFGAICASLAGPTYFLCTQTDLEWTRDGNAPYVFGAVFLAAGVAHFTAHRQFCSMMPPKGTWGVWYLPGSDSFHVNWTGVAEIAGGAALLASTLDPVSQALPWLQSTTAFCLFMLCIAVYPANIFMATHNAPGPGPEGVALPLWGHVARGILQVVLWASLWGLAHPPPA